MQDKPSPQPSGEEQPEASTPVDEPAQTKESAQGNEAAPTDVSAQGNEPVQSGGTEYIAEQRSAEAQHLEASGYTGIAAEEYREYGADKPQEIEKASVTPESVAREVTELREEVASTQRQMAAMENRFYSRGDPQPVLIERERGGCLTAWLVFIVIANVAAPFLLGTFGAFSLITLLTGVIAIAGVVGMWQFKKWGYYVILVCYGIALIVNLTGSIGGVVGTLIGVGITSALVLSKWDLFE